MNFDTAQKIVNTISKGKVVYLQGMHDDGRLYHHLKIVGTKRSDFAECAEINDLIRATYRLMRPKLFRITKVCMDLIGRAVYIDKTIRVTVKSIQGSEDGLTITTTEGRTYSASTLYIKEGENETV